METIFMTTDQTNPTSDGIGWRWNWLGTGWHGMDSEWPWQWEDVVFPGHWIKSLLSDPDQCQRKTDKLAFFPFSGPAHFERPAD